MFRSPPNFRRSRAESGEIVDDVLSLGPTRKQATSKPIGTAVKFARDSAAVSGQNDKVSANSKMACSV